MEIVSDIAIFVLTRDVKLQLINYWWRFGFRSESANCEVALLAGNWISDPADGRRVRQLLHAWGDVDPDPWVPVSGRGDEKDRTEGRQAVLCNGRRGAWVHQRWSPAAVLQAFLEPADGAGQAQLPTGSAAWWLVSSWQCRSLLQSHFVQKTAFARVLKWRKKISPWIVLKFGIGLEKVLKKCWYLITMVLKNQLGQRVSCPAVVSNRTVTFLFVINDV